ncbi:hypothetical protein [Actinoplanes sp. NPDC049265]|uniref:hypothetical protein n=1 Tax=Actinoplanes sp. NPDC049265 TaxID=3363902 RepID=UPI00371AEEDC
MNPDDVTEFRCARLLLLLDLVHDELPDGVDAERIALYDFFAAHPLLLARDSDDPDRLSLRLAGFDDRAVGYASAGQRLATALQRISGDLAVLVSTGLAGMTTSGRIRYRLTPAGRAAAAGLTAAYAVSYVAAARIVLRRLRRLSGRRLRETVRRSTTFGYPTAAPGHPAAYSTDAGDQT